MKSRYFVISESERDLHPIKVTFKKGTISFAIENVEKIKSTEGFLVCPKCKKKLEKKTNIKRKKCGKCKKDLVWDLQDKWQEQSKTTDALRVLKKFFIKQDLTNISRSSMTSALDLVDREKIDELLKCAVNAMMISNVKITERMDRIEKEIENINEFARSQPSSYDIDRAVQKSCYRYGTGTAADNDYRRDYKYDY